MLRQHNTVDDFLRVEYDEMAPEEAKFGWEKAKSAAAGTLVGIVLGFVYAVIIFIN